MDGLITISLFQSAVDWQANFTHRHALDGGSGSHDITVHRRRAKWAVYCGFPLFFLFIFVMIQDISKGGGNNAAASCVQRLADRARPGEGIELGTCRSRRSVHESGLLIVEIATSCR